MRKRILTLSVLLLAMTAMQTVFAALYYNIKVGGVEVNSDNASNITGSRIKAYDANVNGGKPLVTFEGNTRGGTLTLWNVRIERDGSGNRAILNDGNPDLTIVLKGENYFYAKDASPVRLNGKTTIICQLYNGINHTTIAGGSEDALTVGSGADVTITTANLTLTSESSCFDAEGSPTLSIVNSTVEATCSTNKSNDCYALHGYKKLTVSNSIVKLKGYSQAVRNLKELSLASSMYIADGITFNSSQGTFVNASGKVAKEVTLAYGTLIDSTNFPDNNFRNLLSLFDSNKNGVFSDDELANVKSLNVTGRSIATLKGIEFFTQLERLSCGNNNLMSLDLSANKKLNYLDCSMNRINDENMGLLAKSLPTVTGGTFVVMAVTNSDEYNSITKNQQFEAYNKGWQQMSQEGTLILLPITDEYFPDNYFRSHLSSWRDTDEDGMLCLNEILSARIINFSYTSYALNDLTGIEHLLNLRELDCSYASLSAIDLTKNTRLELLNCSYASVHQLDLTNNKRLTKVQCEGCSLNALDVSGCQELQLLNCSMNRIYKLNLTNNTKLTKLQCNNNCLETLDVSNHTALTILDCSSNDLETLNVSGCTSLQTLNCFSNELKSLDVTTCSALKELTCSFNDLTSLNLLNCPQLQNLNCVYNSMKSLNLSACKPLTELRIYCNRIEANAMDQLVGTLPTISEGTLYAVLFNADREHNDIHRNIVAKASGKGWKVMYKLSNLSSEDWKQFPALKPCDANGDGAVDVADISTIISVMASEKVSPVTLRIADVNVDGTVDVADISTVISFMAEN